MSQALLNATQNLPMGSISFSRPNASLPQLSLCPLNCQTQLYFIWQEAYGAALLHDLIPLPFLTIFGNCTIMNTAQFEKKYLVFELSLTL